MTGSSARRLRVIEIAQGVGGPACGRMFAGLGHDVVKCEPLGGDYLRGFDPRNASGVGLAFCMLNAGKRSIVADVDRKEDQQLIRGLLDAADVLIIDLPPQKARSAGLDHRDVLGEWPSLVIVSVTAFGLDNPWSEREGDSLLAESLGGLATMIGDPDGRPLALGGEQAAYAAGFAGFFGATVALKKRDRDGRGDLVDVALCDLAAYMDWKTDIGFALAGSVGRRSGASSRRWRMLRSTDGWVGIVFAADQWDEVVQLVGDERLADPELRDETVREKRSCEWWPIIERWAALRSKRVIHEEARGLGLPFGYCADMRDLVASPQYKSRGFVASESPSSLDGPEASAVGPPWHSGELMWSSGTPPKCGEHQAEVEADLRDGHSPSIRMSHPHTSTPALDGVIVLDFGTITAGAATSRLLADCGATVIKVESLSHPDPFRNWMQSAIDDSQPIGGNSTGAYLFDSNNAGKFAIALELDTIDGRESLAHLVKQADVLIENYRVGVTERLGIDYRSLSIVNPHLIYLSLSSQGQHGPEAGSRSYGSTLDLLSGLASLTGYDADHPLWSGPDVNYPDQLASLFGAALVAYCLCQGIRGTRIDVSQREVVSWTLADRIVDCLLAGRTATADGNHRPGYTPHDTYPCAGDDSWVAISCRTSNHRDHLAVLVANSLHGHPPQWWEARVGMVDRLIQRWTAVRTQDECIAELLAAGVPCAPVLKANQRAQDPRFLERGVYLGESQRLKGFPVRMLRNKPSTGRGAPKLGEHTEQVLRILAEGSKANILELLVQPARRIRSGVIEEVRHG